MDETEAPAGDGRRFWFGLAVIAGLGLCWRISYAVIFKHPADACGRARCGDAIYYVAQARRNVRGTFFEDPANLGMPAADHPPVTAALLTPAALLRDSDVLASRVTMALVGTATIVTLALLARRLAGDLAGWLAAGLAAANPNLWMNDALPMAEAPAALMIALILLGTYVLLSDGRRRTALLLGIACGVAVLTRGELALLVPLTITPALLWPRAGPLTQSPLVRRLGLAAIVGVVGVAIVLPWSAFNTARFSEPVLLSTNDGLTLLGANCDPVYHGGGTGFWNLECARGLEEQIPAGADQAERSSVYRDAAFDYISQNRDEIPRVVAARLGRLFAVWNNEQMVWLNQNEGRESWASWSGIAAFWMFVPLAVGGAILLRSRRTAIWPLVSTGVLVTITAVFFYGIVRFRLPLDVAMVPLAAVALTWLAQRAFSQPRDQVASQ